MGQLVSYKFILFFKRESVDINLMLFFSSDKVGKWESQKVRDHWEDLDIGG
jgi:hypothetical protein